MNQKKVLVYTSLVCAIIFSFVPAVGLLNGAQYQHFGVPAETLIYYGGWSFHLNPLAMFLNYLCFYIIFKVAIKLWNLFTVKVDK